MRNRNLIEGIVGIVFGGAITLNGLVNGVAARAGESPYAMGAFFALLMGVTFLIAGIYYVRKGLRERSR